MLRVISYVVRSFSRPSLSPAVVESLLLSGCSCLMRKPRQPWSEARDSGYGAGEATEKLPCSRVIVVWKPTLHRWVNKRFHVQRGVSEQPIQGRVFALVCMCVCVFACVEEFEKFQCAHSELFHAECGLDMCRPKKNVRLLCWDEIFTIGCHLYAFVCVVRVVYTHLINIRHWQVLVYISRSHCIILSFM